MTVGELMQREVVTLKADDTLDLAEDIMRLGRIRHMPVLAGERLVGLLSQRDLFRAAISSVLQFRPTAEREWLAGIHVREVMIETLVTTTPQTPIREAARLLVEKKIGCLPVLEGERLVGLLSESDCLDYLVRKLGEERA
jgi:CBS domain-containing protein